ncbi:MAG: nitroreductase/quinone reductase family protein [Haloarculaceae archaeon]
MKESASTTRPPPRVSSAQRAIEERLANPLFRSVLRSRFHWVASTWLLLVSYVGRRSGRTYTFPVAYHQLDGAVVAVTPKRESVWWRNFRDARECRVWLRGTEHTATGELVTGPERGRLLGAYFENHGLLGRMLGSEVETGASPDRRAEANRDIAVVRFLLDET